MLKRLLVITCLAAATAAAPAQPVRELRLTRELRIDAIEHDLSPLGWIAVGPDGTIALVQRQDGLIRFFSANGRPSGTFGRRGQGPGEFETFGRLTWIADTLVVNDVTRRRHTFISPDQKLVRVRSWPQSITTNSTGQEPPRFSFPLPWAVLANGDQLVAAPLAEGSPLPDWPGAIRSGLPWIRVDSTGAFRHVIAWQISENCEVRIADGRGTAAIPFCWTVRSDISPDGSRLALAWTDPGGRTSYSVGVFRVTGDTAFQRTYPFRPIPLTRAERDRAIAALPKFPGIDEALEKASIPAHRPPVARILLGRDETTWIELTTVTGDRIWHVLDTSGGVIGRIRLTRNVFATVVLRDQLWATETDDDGLQHIVRYRVSR